MICIAFHDPYPAWSDTFRVSPQKSTILFHCCVKIRDDVSLWLTYCSSQKPSPVPLSLSFRVLAARAFYCIGIKWITGRLEPIQKFHPQISFFQQRLEVRHGFCLGLLSVLSSLVARW